MSSLKDNKVSRRSFIGKSVAAAGALTLAPGLSSTSGLSAANSAKFKLNYGPHLGMFKHHAGDDPVDQIKFMADQGFTAFEDNGMMNKPVDLQERIAKELRRQDMIMGVFVTYAEFNEPTMVMDDPDVRDMLKERMNQAVEVAKRVNAKWTTVVPGAYHEGMAWEYQTANVVENLKFCADILEPEGIVMVLEPLNWYANHPGVFLTKVPQAYQICQAVNSPSVKILDDLYHQQITEGNLIPNMDKAWSEIAYIQVGDNPGRKEPTTGEINYKNIFKHLYTKEFDGVIGMEHGNSIPGEKGEKALIQAYREVDSFTV